MGAATGVSASNWATSSEIVVIFAACTGHKVEGKRTTKKDGREACYVTRRQYATKLWRGREAGTQL